MVLTCGMRMAEVISCNIWPFINEFHHVNVARSSHRHDDSTWYRRSNPIMPLIHGECNPWLKADGKLPICNSKR